MDQVNPVSLEAGDTTFELRLFGHHREDGPKVVSFEFETGEIEPRIGATYTVRVVSLKHETVTP